MDEIKEEIFDDTQELPIEEEQESMGSKFWKHIMVPFDKLKKMTLSDLGATIIMILPYALLFSIFIAIPVAVAVFLSFTSFNMIETPTFTGFTNYIYLLTQDEIFLEFVLPNTLKYSLIVGPGGYVLSFLFAWMLAQIQKLPRTILAMILYLPSMIGGVFTSIIWKTMFNGSESGYINSILLQLDIIDVPIDFLQNPAYLLNICIIVALWSSMGVGFLSILSGMLNIPQDQYEAAHIDGIKNRFQEIRFVTIPNMKPQMLFGAVMAIVNAFNNGYIGVQLSGVNPTPEYSAQLMINHIEDYAYARYEMGYAAALSVVLLLVVWLFTKVAYKLFGED